MDTKIVVIYDNPERPVFFEVGYSDQLSTSPRCQPSGRSVLTTSTRSTTRANVATHS